MTEKEEGNTAGWATNRRTSILSVIFAAYDGTGTPSRSLPDPDRQRHLSVVFALCGRDMSVKSEEVYREGDLLENCAEILCYCLTGMTKEIQFLNGNWR